MEDPKENKTFENPGEVKENAETSQNNDPGCRGDCAQYLDKLAYLSADFENYRKNVIKERALWGTRAQGEVLKTILPVVDDFERALGELNSAEMSEGDRKRFEGFQIIYESLLKLLQSHGVKEIEETKIFDPKLHEAVVQVDSEEAQSGEIVEVLEKGYMHEGNVLRPAKVSVAK